MAQKLTSGDKFPNLHLNIVGEATRELPSDLDSPMTVALFYRGHWWPYCRRLLAGYEARREAFAEQGVNIIAGAVDSEENTAAVARGLGFPVAFGMTKADGEMMGSWWDEKRECIQPSEFLLSKSGRVMISGYSNGPVGRMDPEETLNLIKYLNEQRTQAANS